MAENINALILPIGADATQFKRSIEEVKDAIKKLSTSISSTSFNLVSPEQKTELANLKRTLSELQTDVINTGNAFAKGEESTKKAGRALTSLSLVAQDAPFGFIAIQNNLPGVIQAFGQLDTKTNGLKGTLKELGSALIGPAGAFLAFSAVTAAVTFAVRQYGSLGNAINALISSNGKLYLELGKVNKEYDNYLKNNDSLELSISKTSASQQGQITTIQLLTEQVGNLSLSESQRSNALKQLKDIDKDYYGNLSTAESDTEKVRKATDLLTQSIINQAKAKGLSDTISEITKQISALEFAQKKLAPEFTKLANEAEPEIKRLQNSLQQGLFGGFTVQGLLKISEFGTVTDALKKGDEQINNELANLNATKEELKKTLTEITQAFIPDESKKGKDFVLGIDPQDLDAAFNLDKIISNVNKLGNTILDTNKPLKERQQALKELIAVNPELFNGLTLEKNGLQSLKTTVEDYTRSLKVLIKEREFDSRASQLNAQFLKIQEKATEDANKAEQDRLSGLIELTYAQDRFGNSTDKIVKKNNTYLDQLGELQEFNEGVIDILNKGLGAENIYEKAIKDLLNFETYQKAAADRISKNFRFLQNPLEDLFGSVLEDGIANWQAFGDAVVAEIKKIVAALIAKGVIQLLASLLAPGVGSLIGGGGAALGQDAFERYFKIFDFNPQGSKVNFSGVQGGGMQMAGAVNLTLRGSDLVGAINRTNATINRIG